MVIEFGVEADIGSGLADDGGFATRSNAPIRRKRRVVLMGKRALTLSAFVFLLMVQWTPATAQATVQDSPYLAEVATGEGTITVDNDQRLTINAVAVFLEQNGEAEIWLMTGKQNVYAGGRWAHSSCSTPAIQLSILDDTEGNRASGQGTIVIQGGCVPVARVQMTVTRMDGTTFVADFVGTDPQSCEN
ncbi:MAG TPA: hypothetical protein VKM94_26410 [Blastocatellia bacterium]|nr:hypothetical protein [Blastocatellia bacterium]